MKRYRLLDGDGDWISRANGVSNREQRWAQLSDALLEMIQLHNVGSKLKLKYPIQVIDDSDGKVIQSIRTEIVYPLNMKYPEYKYLGIIDGQPCWEDAPPKKYGIDGLIHPAYATR